MKEYMANKRLEGKYKTELTEEQKQRMKIRRKVLYFYENARIRIENTYYNYLWRELRAKNYPINQTELGSFVKTFYERFPEFKSKYGASPELFVEKVFSDAIEIKRHRKISGGNRTRFVYSDGSSAHMSFTKRMI